MLPEAWNVEHNSLHHYKLGEVGDPDLVERSLAFLRDNKKVPMVFKYGYVAMVMCMWKWSYYAPNTFKQLKMQEMRRNKQELPEGVDPHSAVTIFEALSGTAGVYGAGEYLKRVMLPYLLLHFVALPLPFLALGGGFFANAVINLLLALSTCVKSSPVPTIARGVTPMTSCMVGSTTKLSTMCGRTSPCCPIRSPSQSCKLSARSMEFHMCRRMFSCG